MNAQQARELVQLARKHNVYFQGLSFHFYYFSFFCSSHKINQSIEAMWTRTFPLMGKVRELIKSGAIGDVISVTVNQSTHTHMIFIFFKKKSNLGGFRIS